MVSKKHSLTKINLSENELKDQGAITIGKALEDDFQWLCIVDLSANGIETDGGMSLAKAVADKPVFRLLNINGNLLSYKGIEGVREIFKIFPRKIGPLDDNDPHDKDDDDKSDEPESKDLETSRKE
ncbi:hypothetical protein R6Q59_027082 [Mikania micrantha]